MTTRHTHRWGHEHPNQMGYSSRVCRGCGALQVKTDGRWRIAVPGDNPVRPTREQRDASTRQAGIDTFNHLRREDLIREGWDEAI